MVTFYVKKVLGSSKNLLKTYLAAVKDCSGYLPYYLGSTPGSLYLLLNEESKKESH